MRLIIRDLTKTDSGACFSCLPASCLNVSPANSAVMSSAYHKSHRPARGVETALETRRELWLQTQKPGSLASPSCEAPAPVTCCLWVEPRQRCPFPWDIPDHAQLPSVEVWLWDRDPWVRPTLTWEFYPTVVWMFHFLLSWALSCCVTWRCGLWRSLFLALVLSESPSFLSMYSDVTYLVYTAASLLCIQFHRW